MASNEMIVHITADDMRPTFEEIRHNLAEIREHIAALYDGLDAWSGRIQRLEALPGVAEALAAADAEGDK